MNFAARESACIMFHAKTGLSLNPSLYFARKTDLQVLHAQYSFAVVDIRENRHKGLTECRRGSFYITLAELLSCSSHASFGLLVIFSSSVSSVIGICLLDFVLCKSGVQHMPVVPLMSPIFASGKLSGSADGLTGSSILLICYPNSFT